MSLLTSKNIGKAIGFSEPHLKHIKDKIKRDSLYTKGDNKLNPFKNRGNRWKLPIILFKDQIPPPGWVETKISVEKKKRYKFSTNKKGWGFYVTETNWSKALQSVRKKRQNVDIKKGRFKIGIPYEEAATEQDCIGVALTLSYQAHRILGQTEETIKTDHPHLFEAVKGYPALQKPLCPFCKKSLKPTGFVEASQDTDDVFYKRDEAKDDAIQLFHINCLKPGKFLHRPGNVSWGHRRCNVAVSQHDVTDAEGWFKEVLENRGYKVLKELD
ncbi:MAG TPA: hypothetical protein PLT76_03040 [Candidatus Omnitrophota bacterium]|nr:hypothetical protein [Candidatus Omnitrophota bacterium]